MKITTDHISVTGITVFGVLAGLATIVCAISLCAMLINSGGIPSHRKYTSMRYQEYLIKNPSVKVFVGNKQLSEYKNEEFAGPIVLKVVTPGGQTYESFIERSEKEVIGNKLLASLNST